MKQKDIVLVIVIAFVSAIISFVVSNALFASPKSRNQTIEVVQAINANFPSPNAKYFNNQSIDPTQLIQIGSSNNNAPFNGSSQ